MSPLPLTGGGIMMGPIAIRPEATGTATAWDWSTRRTNMDQGQEMNEPGADSPSERRRVVVLKHAR
jgi:hypothetical protein